MKKLLNILISLLCLTSFLFISESSSYASQNPPNSCAVCILQYQRHDILPFFIERDQAVDPNTWNERLNTWCGLDPTACNTLKGGACSAQCANPPTADNPQTQTDCILRSRTDILESYSSSRWGSGGWSANWNNRCTILPFSVPSGTYPSINRGRACNGDWNGILSDWCKVDPNGCSAIKSAAGARLDDGTTVSCLTTTPGRSVSPASSSTTSPPIAAQAVGTAFYRVSETRFESTDASPDWQPFTNGDQNGQLNISFSFANENPGTKFVFVQFKAVGGTVSPLIQKSINFVGADPQITGCSPSLDSTGAVIFDIAGTHFGSSQGSSKITANSTNTTITDWSDTAIAAKLTGTTVVGDQQFTVVFTRSDGVIVTVPSSDCKLGVSQISLGANLFCRASNPTVVNNVTATIVENVKGATSVTETALSIDKDGIIQGLKTKLQKGKQYKIGIKAPRSLRKVVEASASAGTTRIANLSLPIGDISPAAGDGRINSADGIELINQWRLISGTGTRIGDFNSDGLVNSVDWACFKLSTSTVSVGFPTDDPEPVGGSTTDTGSTDSSTACTIVDINKDDIVNIKDFSILRACMGKSLTDKSGVVSCAAADLNSDGKVDAADNVLLQSQFGKTCH